MVFPQVIAAFHALFDAIGLSGNFLVILTIILERRLHKMSYFLLASLAVSDFLCLILVNSFRIASIAEESWLYGQTMCHLNSCFHRYFYVNTILHLLAVSYDRYKAIVKSPLTYDGTVTSPKMLLVLLIWLMPIPLSIGPFLGYGMFVYNPEVYFCENGWVLRRDVLKTRKVFFTVITLLGPFVVILFLNWSVCKTAKRQINALAQEAQLGSLDDSVLNVQQELARRKKERRASFDVFIIIAAFLICFLPLWVVSFCRQYATRIKVSSQVVLLSNCLFFVSSLCNPIIYSIRKKEFRDAVKKMFSRMGLFVKHNENDVIAIGINNLAISGRIDGRGSTWSYTTTSPELYKHYEDIREIGANVPPSLYAIPEIDGY
ncbi:unnamed protein product [Porites lobata]|uniref:G-protein coupled receptors family 1 profile domain-containing protein n=1 Tax=Porites lobata TaxID=104759 RepID=A0ABN8NSD4_9CNID|nr:unnamed protein product [Porites lobata]